MDDNAKARLVKVAQCNALFTPKAPITSRDMFIGRLSLIEKLTESMFAVGSHVVVFGDRGVGKTSLVNVHTELLRSVVTGAPFHTAQFTCLESTTYDDAMKQVLKDVRVSLSREVRRAIGYQQPSTSKEDVVARLSDLVETVAPRDIIRVVKMLDLRLWLVFDEFDRLSVRERRAFADAIKSFSDAASHVTLVLVGVAHSVDELVQDHASIVRALLQLRVPRMEPQDAHEVLTTRWAILHMSAPTEVGDALVNLSQGLPHFVHLLGLEATLAAVREDSAVLTMAHVREGVRSAINNASQTIIHDYQTATKSPRVDALFTKVLCACAMAKTDFEGFFTARQVLPHLRRIHSPNARIATFTKHLDGFNTAERASVIEKVGSRRKYRYRVRNPMMKAYILIQAVNNNAIDVGDVSYEPAIDILRDGVGDWYGEEGDDGDNDGNDDT